jgi:hypothetical protein
MLTRLPSYHPCANQKLCLATIGKSKDQSGSDHEEPDPTKHTHTHLVPLHQCQYRATLRSGFVVDLVVTEARKVISSNMGSSTECAETGTWVARKRVSATRSAPLIVGVLLGGKSKREPRLVPGTSKQDVEARGMQAVSRLPVVRVEFPPHQIKVCKRGKRIKGTIQIVHHHSCRTSSCACDKLDCRNMTNWRALAKTGNM